MIKLRDYHPSESDLLLLADGELESRKGEAIRAHLEECWSCRVRLDHIHTTITAFVDYRENFLNPVIPPRALSGRSLDARLRELERHIHPSSTVQLRARVQRIPWTPVFTAFTAVALLAVFFLSITRVPVASANDVIRRSIAAERITRPVHQQVRIRQGTNSVTRDLWRDAQSRPIGERNSRRLAHFDEQLDGTLSKLGWNVDDPLSARNFAQWRAGIQSARDSVEEEAGYVKVRTVASAAEVLEAGITVRANDYHVVETHLRLNGEDEIEIREICFEAGVLPPVPVAANRPAKASVPVEAAPSEPAVAERLEIPDPAEIEVAVRYALHRIGADMGEPVEVRRNGSGQVFVEAAVSDSMRLDAIQRAIGDVPMVTEAAAADFAAAPPVDLASRVIGKPLGPLPALESKFPDHDHWIEFGNSTIKVSRTLLLRAFALRNLARSCPDSQLEQLTPKSRALVLEVRNDHADALRRELPQLVAAISTLVSIPTAARPFEHSVGWQDMAVEFLAAVREADAMCNVLFAEANTELTAPRIIDQLAQSLSNASQIASMWKNPVHQRYEQ